MPVERTQASIAPGSVPYGERGALESAISTAGTGNAGQAPAPSPAAGGALPAPGNPISALLTGELGQLSNGPVTSGLSVGAGPGPDSENPALANKVERLRAVVQGSKDPALRLAAARMLRRLTRGA